MRKIVLNEGLYFWLKWLCVIVLPAIATLIIGLSKVWGWEALGANIAQSITLIGTCLGTILCISNHNFYSNKEEEKHEKND